MVHRLFTEVTVPPLYSGGNARQPQPGNRYVGGDQRPPPVGHSCGGSVRQVENGAGSPEIEVLFGDTSHVARRHAHCSLIQIVGQLIAPESLRLTQRGGSPIHRLEVTSPACGRQRVGALQLLVDRTASDQLRHQFCTPRHRFVQAGLLALDGKVEDADLCRCVVRRMGTACKARHPHGPVKARSPARSEDASGNVQSGCVGV